MLIPKRSCLSDSGSLRSSQTDLRWWKYQSCHLISLCPESGVVSNQFIFSWIMVQIMLLKSDVNDIWMKNFFLIFKTFEMFKNQCKYQHGWQPIFCFTTNQISGCFACALQGKFYEAVHRSAAAGDQLFIPASPLCVLFLMWPLQTLSHRRQQVHWSKGSQLLKTYSSTIFIVNNFRSLWWNMVKVPHLYTKVHKLRTKGFSQWFLLASQVNF